MRGLPFLNRRQLEGNLEKIQSNDSNCILNVKTINIFVALYRLEIAYCLLWVSNFINVCLFVCLFVCLLTGLRYCSYTDFLQAYDS